ncbi:DUF6602 domain-containing protein [Spirillospora sp. NPDC029432]|uniref:DUF6602 domain-containing protein n=1 Tax=Spirillospora sp. NPDC029432 TaxID=3154599 RepID=UPI003451D3A7
MQPHELHMFFDQVASEMRSEYSRIYRRSREDPGTAGDEGESNWAALLADWIPADIHVATKGRILGADGTASPQLDVVLLSGDYPRKLREKKLYLAGGVIAAFECKNTLRKQHISKLFSNAAAIRKLSTPNDGNFYGEVFGTITYGLLAHSHEWSPERGAQAVDTEIRRLHAEAKHPGELPAMICVSDLHTWQHMYMPLEPRSHANPIEEEYFSMTNRGKWSYFTRSDFMRWMPLEKDFKPGEGPQISKERPNPIGELILCLLRHLSHRDSGREQLTQYYQKVGLSGGVGNISTAHWDPPEVYSERLMSILKSEDWSQLERLGNKHVGHLP